MKVCFDVGTIGTLSKISEKFEVCAHYSDPADARDTEYTNKGYNLGNHLMHAQARTISKIFDAYFSKGENIGDRDILVKIGRSSNINEKEINDMFSSDKEINKINKSDILARSMGINGVPFFEINNKTYISGAQSSKNIIEAIKANL